jgi:four helix bundle protein
MNLIYQSNIQPLQGCDILFFITRGFAPTVIQIVPLRGTIYYEIKRISSNYELCIISMKENVIKDKSFAFALRIVKLYKFLCESKKEYVLGKQLLRSGTAVGALIREAEHAESKADFIHKIAIAQKEANETEYWIELLFRSEYIDENSYLSVKADVQELNKIIASIIITSKRNK